MGFTSIDSGNADGVALELVLTPAMLGAASSAAGTARRDVQQFLCDSSTPPVGRVLLSDVLLVVSELVTNSVVHASAAPQVVVRVTPPAGVRVEVSDPLATAPVHQVPTPDEAGGRGLNIVHQLAEDWGVQQHPGDGKTVWAALRTA